MTVSSCKQSGDLFDDLVGTGEQRRRDGDSNHLGRLQIDDELKVGWMLHCKLG